MVEKPHSVVNAACDEPWSCGGVGYVLDSPHVTCRHGMAHLIMYVIINPMGLGGGGGVERQVN